MWILVLADIAVDQWIVHNAAIFVHNFSALQAFWYPYLESWWKKFSNLIEILSKAVEIQNSWWNLICSLIEKKAKIGQTD